MHYIVQSDLHSIHSYIIPGFSMREMIENTAKHLGLNVVELQHTKSFDKPAICIRVERDVSDAEDARVSIQDCSDMTNMISLPLVVNGYIDDKTILVVESVGVERPLLTHKDYERFFGRAAKIYLIEPIDNVKELECKIKSIENGVLHIEHNNVYSIEMKNIKKANLVLTDEMFRKIIKGTK